MFVVVCFTVPTAEALPYTHTTAFLWTEFHVHHLHACHCGCFKQILRFDLPLLFTHCYQLMFDHSFIRGSVGLSGMYVYKWTYVHCIHVARVAVQASIAMYTHHCISWDRVSCPLTHVCHVRTYVRLSVSVHVRRFRHHHLFLQQSLLLVPPSCM